ncbi:MAG: hypothetical protein K2Q07_03440 [Burkholderiaceae bacterium]|nr:hypothetical protein [Burkholderiaceae bacterium]
MKKTLALLLALTAFTSAQAETSVGVSIGINQPGVYGRINIGDVPRPALVYPQPVIIAPPTIAYPRQPIYLYVPPVHQHDWRRYCGRYNACGQPVYFVQDQWVRERYQQEHPGWDKGRKRGWDKHDDRGNGRGKGRDDDRGRGHDH